MPHFKCVACQYRLFSPPSSDDTVGDLCPGCGSLLEPVAELSELVGFRSITPRASVADGTPAGAHRRLAERVADVAARREATLAQARLDASRWVDDGGGFSPEAVAEAVALARPRTNP